MKQFFSIIFSALIFVVCHTPVSAQQPEAKPSPFDSYGAISSEDASARLDAFAIGLRGKPELIGYIICYGPQGGGSGSGNHLSRVTRDYLVNLRGIDSNRIQTIYSGRYKDPADIFTELWLVPLGTAPPEPRRYASKLKTITGEFSRSDGWEDAGEGATAPYFGNSTLAAFADALREQPKSVGYIVASNVRGATPGTWRRVAKREAAELQDHGILADRIKIIYGGAVKVKEEYPDLQRVKLQFWILPADSPPPVREAKPERTPKEASPIGSYNEYQLRLPKR
jgi:hypothetical protein